MPLERSYSNWLERLKISSVAIESQFVGIRGDLGPALEENGHLPTVLLVSPGVLLDCTGETLQGVCHGSLGQETRDRLAHEGGAEEH